MEAAAYKSLFRRSILPSVVVDKTLLIVDASDSLAEITNAACPAPRTAHLSTVIPESVAASALTAVFDSGQPAVVPWARYDLHISGIPEIGDDSDASDPNTPPVSYAVIQFVELRHQQSGSSEPREGTDPASASDETYHLLVETIQDYAIFMLDVNGYILTWNNGARRVKRYEASEIIGKHFSVFYLPEDLQQRKPEHALAIALTHGRAEDEFWRVRKDGSQFWASVSITPLYKNGRHIGFAKVTRDLTERHLSKLAVREAYKDAEKLKSSFLSTASHELRSPLNGVLAGIQLLATMDPTEEQLETFKIIQQAGKSLARIIDDILVHSKLEANKLVLEQGVIGIHDIVRTLVKTYRLQTDNQLQFAIDDSVPASAIGDATRFTQVMSNLVDNAIKFTKDGSVNLNISASPPVSGPGGTTFVLTTVISDTGIGIDAKNRAKLFHPFSQVDTSYSKRPGTGLGLSICSDLVKLMNGDISVESEVGKGTQVKYTLQLGWNTDISAPVQAERPSRCLSAPGKAAPSRRILIAEDNPINATLLRRLLLKNGYEDVHHAKDGLEAVEQFFTLKPDIVLMDVQMPRMDGYEATKQIRAQDTHTPIIALTASASSEDREISINAGMNDHVAKPFEINHVIRTIEKLLSVKTVDPPLLSTLSLQRGP